MSEALPEALDAWLDEGLTRFHNGRFWHAHESWEDAWRACPTAERDFFQGLILVAAALFKLDQQRGRPHALVRLLGKARERLEPYPDVFYELFLPHLFAAIDALEREGRRYLEDEEDWQERFNRGLIPILDRG